MLPSLALSIGSLLLVNGQQASQAVFNSESGRNVITDFSKSASCREIFNSLNIHGLSLAVVSRDGDPEFCACGNRTEEGDPMTSKVSMLQYLSAPCELIATRIRRSSILHHAPRPSSRLHSGF